MYWNWVYVLYLLPYSQYRQQILQSNFPSEIRKYVAKHVAQYLHYTASILQLGKYNFSHSRSYQIVSIKV